MGYIHTVNVDNNHTYLIEPILFTSLTNTGNSSASLTATINNFELVAGVTISIFATVNNSTSATLSINNGAAKPLYYKGSTIEADIIKKNYIYTLVYDGTNWHVVGEKLASSEMRLPHKLTFGSGGVYEFDGSVDVTVPVYTGSAI